MSVCRFFIVVISIFLLSVISLRPVAAVSVATPTASPSAKPRASDFLERFATSAAVTELTNKLRRTYSGRIQALGKTSLTLTTADGNKPVTFNDATAFYRLRAGQRTEIAAVNLKLGDDIVVLGNTDPVSKEMVARQIIAKTRRYNIVGNISTISGNLYSVKELGGSITQVDLTDIPVMKKISGDKIVSAKLSDFKVGSLVFVIAYVSDPGSPTLSALKAMTL